MPCTDGTRSNIRLQTLQGGRELLRRLLTASLVTGDRCYDFLNIFAEKFSENFGVFDTKQSYIMEKFDHNIGF
jgi:hypothetical protein